MAVQNILPDPISPINIYGEDTAGSYGPGFASISVSSLQPITTNRSRSGLAFRQISTYHEWEVSVNYNPLTKAEFNVVYSFLLERQSSLEPFYVGLPQYSKPSVSDKEITVTAEAGSTQLTLSNTTGIEVGDMFNITDPGDDTHVKAYTVVRMGTSNSIHISPALQRKVFGNTSADATFAYPTVQVMLDADNLDYSISLEGLYSLSLKLKETLV